MPIRDVRADAPNAVASTVVGATLALAVQVAHADGSGWYTSAQMSQARWEFSQKCALCHGAPLKGGAPALKGSAFAQPWDGKKLSDFYSFVHTDMLLGLGASLPSDWHS